MADAFTLFIAPAAFFGALASPSADAFKPALRRLSSLHVASTHENTCNIVTDNDQSITMSDVPVIVVSSATLTSIHESPAVNTPALSSPRSSIISAFTTSSAASSSSSTGRTSFTTSLRKTFSQLSLSSSSPSPPAKKSMAEDMDMDLCCRGEDASEDGNEDEDEYPIALEHDDSTVISVADSQAAPLAPSIQHNIDVDGLVSAQPKSALATGEPIASSELVSSGEPLRSISSSISHGDTPELIVSTSSSRSLIPESIKNSDLAPARTMRCAVGTCSENCVHLASAQPIVRGAKRSRRNAVAGWVRGLAARAA